MPFVHSLPVRVYYEDTDFSGVVYHANYLRFLERGRSEMLRSLGVHHRSLFEGAAGSDPVGFVVRSLDIEFVAPARMDDSVDVETRVEEARGASAIMRQRILRAGSLLTIASVRVATVSKGRVVRFPPVVRAAFERALR